ncbi:MAG: hypothetical protein M1837_007475 [Sclerophora amabilis]|nr:MAG: hypothetical protein M1837_007475 [Sclerophora amabilis]
MDSPGSPMDWQATTPPTFQQLAPAPIDPPENGLLYLRHSEPARPKRKHTGHLADSIFSELNGWRKNAKQPAPLPNTLKWYQGKECVVPLNTPVTGQFDPSFYARSSVPAEPKRTNLLKTPPSNPFAQATPAPCLLGPKPAGHASQSKPTGSLKTLKIVPRHLRESNLFEPLGNGGGASENHGNNGPEIVMDDTGNAQGLPAPSTQPVDHSLPNPSSHPVDNSLPTQSTQHVDHNLSTQTPQNIDRIFSNHLTRPLELVPLPAIQPTEVEPTPNDTEEVEAEGDPGFTIVRDFALSIFLLSAFTIFNLTCTTSRFLARNACTLAQSRAFRQAPAHIMRGALAVGQVVGEGASRVKRQCVEVRPRFNFRHEYHRIIRNRFRPTARDPRRSPRTPPPGMTSAAAAQRAQSPGFQQTAQGQTWNTPVQAPQTPANRLRTPRVQVTPHTLYATPPESPKTPEGAYGTPYSPDQSWGFSSASQDTPTILGAPTPTPLAKLRPRSDAYFGLKRKSSVVDKDDNDEADYPSKKKRALEGAVRPALAECGQGPSPNSSLLSPADEGTPSFLKVSPTAFDLSTEEELSDFYTQSSWTFTPVLKQVSGTSDRKDPQESSPATLESSPSLHSVVTSGDDSGDYTLPPLISSSPAIPEDASALQVAQNEVSFLSDPPEHISESGIDFLPETPTTGKRVQWADDPKTGMPLSRFKKYYKGEKISYLESSTPPFPTVRNSQYAANQSDASTSPLVDQLTTLEAPTTAHERPPTHKEPHHDVAQNTSDDTLDEVSIEPERLERSPQAAPTALTVEESSKVNPPVVTVEESAEVTPPVVTVEESAKVNSPVVTVEESSNVTSPVAIDEESSIVTPVSGTVEGLPNVEPDPQAPSPVPKDPDAPPKTPSSARDKKPKSAKGDAHLFTLSVRTRKGREEQRRKEEEAEALRKAQEAKEQAEREAAEKARLELEAEKDRQARIKRILPGHKVIKRLRPEWDSKVTAAIATRGNRELAWTSTGQALSRHDMGTLLPGYSDHTGGWLNDEIINAYLQAVVDHGLEKTGTQQSGRSSRNRSVIPKFHAFNSFFYKNIREKGPKSVERWSRKVNIQNENLLSVERVFIPVHEGAHWTLLVVSPVNKTIEYFDSLNGAQGRFIANAKLWLKNELGDQYVDDEWRVLNSASPRQRNGYDCGVFTVTTAKMILVGINPLAYSQDDIPLQRRRMVAELINGGFTGDFDPAAMLAEEEELQEEELEEEEQSEEEDDDGDAEGDDEDDAEEEEEEDEEEEDEEDGDDEDEDELEEVNENEEVELEDDSELEEIQVIDYEDDEDEV